MYKSPSLSFSLSFPSDTLAEVDRGVSNKISVLVRSGIHTACVSSGRFIAAVWPALNTSDFTFSHTHTRGKLLRLTPVTSHCQTWHVKVAVQFASVWGDEITKKGVKGQRLCTRVVKMTLYMSKWDVLSACLSGFTSCLTCLSLCVVLGGGG